MKDSTDHLPDASATKYQLCSETTCITCFENRGCMYEQSPVAVIHKMEEPSQQKELILQLN